MNNVDREREERKKKDNDKGESDSERKSTTEKTTPKILVDPQKRTPPPRSRGCPSFFPSPKGDLTVN
jgi:hypothetical protein